MSYLIFFVGFVFLGLASSVPISSNQCVKEDVVGKPSYLWEITSSSSNKTSYLFGTLNVPFDKVHQWLPKNTLMALKTADEIVAEVNLFDKASEDQMKSCQYLPANKTLVDVLGSSGLFGRVERHLKVVEDSVHKWIPNVSNETFAKQIGAQLFKIWTKDLFIKKPHVVAGVIDILEPVLVSNRIRVINNQVYYALSMNDYMMLMGGRRNRMVKALQSGMEACEQINMITHEQGEKNLKEALDKWENVLFAKELEHKDAKNQELIDYKCLKISEDVDAAEKLWATDKIDRLLQDNSNISFLFTFNIYDFFGEKSVVETLKQKGYQVERQIAL